MTRKVRSDHALPALRAAFPHTVPIMAAFLFVGMTYGMLMRTEGFGAMYPMAMSACIYAGSMEFVTVELLQMPFHLAQAFVLTLMINARHLFYGVSMLEKYRGMGWKKPLLIFGLSDETFAVNYSAQIPETVDRGRFFLWVTLLDQFYWFAGASIGALVGQFIPMHVEGLGFAMTAMFTAIFIDQWKREDNKTGALLGLGLPLICLLLFGAESFLIPSMLAILCALLALRRVLERGGDAA